MLPDAPLTLVVGIRGSQPAGLGLVQYVANTTAEPQPLEPDDRLTVMVMRDDDVVALWASRADLSGTPLGPGEMAGAEGASGETGGSMRLTTCQPGSGEGMLLDGEYDVYAIRSDAQGATLGTSGPLALEIDGADTAMSGLTASPAAAPA